MKILSVSLENFKRFSQLQIDNIPETSKLVLIIGANGSGKSSVFDAFEFVNSFLRNDLKQIDELYYSKHHDPDSLINIRFDRNRLFNSSKNIIQATDLSNENFYGRTSFRQVPRLLRTTLGQSDVDYEKDSDRPRYFIDRDNRFENDIEKITGIILQDLFRSNRSNEEVKRQYIDPINVALENIFGDNENTKLQLVEIIPPLEGKVAQITFRKGVSEIHYNYLSAGEKEVVNLLFNLLSRGPLFQDTIYYLDEIDLHLNTKLQYNLLKEITETWIPDNCQLWTASHSLGFIDYAKHADHASILDLDSLDFDQPQVVSPEPKDNPDVYDIAVGKDLLANLFREMDIYFVENKDKAYYATIGIANTVFVSDNNRNSVYHKVRTTKFNGIVDRDFLSDDDMVQIRAQYSKLKVLNYYSIENYMYHPDNLREYHLSKGTDFDKAAYIEQLTFVKNEVKDNIFLSIVSNRLSYPYFGEPEFNNDPLQKRFRNGGENMQQAAMIQTYLNSNDFETYYKSLPMKTYCTTLPQRQNLQKTELVKTQWFREQITTLLR